MKVIFYSTHCPKCRILEQKLKKKNIKYTENNSVDDMLALGITSAPALGVDNVIYNFKEANDWINGQETRSNG